MRLLLTGATGFVGGAVAAALAGRDLLPSTVFLVRAANAAEGARRVTEQLARFGVQAQVAPDQVVLGDLTKPEAFADASGLDGLTQVIHCAALATFSTNPAIWAHNVDGTLALARAAQGGGA
ncbi:MAG: NAD-dependent epimerase/dehydratase family protein [Comamonadaceae bacterium]|nr:MAG: NAD-dependent epimerase/dehydratase family protein [Comamonadaceae bacterium]